MAGFIAERLATPPACPASCWCWRCREKVFTNVRAAQDFVGAMAGSACASPWNLRRRPEFDAAADPLRPGAFLKIDPAIHDRP